MGSTREQNFRQRIEALERQVASVLADRERLAAGLDAQLQNGLVSVADKVVAVGHRIDALECRAASGCVGRMVRLLRGGGDIWRSRDARQG